MEITKEQIVHIAKLSQLSLTEEEISRYGNNLSAIVSYMDKLNELDTSSIAAAEHAFAVPLKLREDVAESKFSREEIVKNSKKEEDGFFIVPKVLE